MKRIFCNPLSDDWETFEEHEDHDYEEDGDEES